MEELKNWEIGSLGEVTVSYVHQSSVHDRPVISTISQAHQLAKRLMDDRMIGLQEQFLVIYLNRANRVLGAKVHFVGGIASVTVDLKIILATALNLLASSVIVCHNHPSGNLEPSPQDQRLTNRLKEALGLLEVELLDHLILAYGGEYYSFKENGLL